MIRPIVSLADLLLAIRHLEVQDVVAQRRIARLLGLSSGPAPTRPKKGQTRIDATPAPSPAVLTEKPDGQGEQGRRQRPLPSPSQDPTETPYRPTRLEQLAEAGRDGPPRKVPELAELLGDGPAHAPNRTEPSLFVGHWRRALLTTALSTPTHDGPIDGAEVVRRVARGAAISDLPRLTLPTLRYGAQLLIDRRPGMRPYAADQDRVKSHVGQVVGQDGLHTAWFSGCPTRGIEPEQRSEADIVDGFDWEPEAYAPPDPHVPVLLLSDLGIGAIGVCRQRADEDEWLAFARRVRSNGNRLLAFVPFPISRWPRRLRRAMTLVEWDRGTSVGVIRRVLCGGRGI